MEGGGEGRKESNQQSQQTPPPSPSLLKKGPWTAEEDAILIDHVRNNGEGNWNSVQKTTGLSRCGKSCRLRWANHLRPNLKKGQLSPEEELVVLRLHAHVGNKWARMAAQLPGRTDNEIKNYWNTRVKRRQRAGLPLYPPSLLQWHRPAPLALPPISPVMFSSEVDFQLPRGKRAREDVGMMSPYNIFPVMPAAGMPRMWQTAPSTPTGPTVFDYSVMPSLSPPPMLPSGYSARMEGPVPLGYSVMGGGGEAELMDRLLQEAERGELQQREMAALSGAGKDQGEWFDYQLGGGQSNGGGGGGDHRVFLDNNIGSISTMQEANPFTQDDILVSDLLEMTPTQPMPTIPQPMPTIPNWNNSDMSSNGGHSVLTDDDLSLDLQHHLASSFSVAPIEQEWNMPSCHWSNVPELV